MQGSKKSPDVECSFRKHRRAGYHARKAGDEGGDPHKVSGERMKQNFQAAWCCSKILSRREGKAATPQGHALDSRPKGCYTPGADGGCTRKSVPEFIATGEYLTTSLWTAVKGGGNCQYSNGKWLNLFATNATKKSGHYNYQLHKRKTKETLYPGIKNTKKGR